MKIYLGIVGLFLALTSVKCGEPPEELKKQYEECRQEIGSELGDPPNFDDHKTKCFSTCLLKKYGTLIDGRVVTEKALEFIRKHKDLPGGRTDQVEANITECSNKANEEKDECEVGAAFQKCMSKYAH